MKLLFVENRYATWVYEQVARELERAGHEIHWMVQNPMFAPRWGTIHRLPFPSASSRSARSTTDYGWLKRTDRGILHFGASDAHYAHYDKSIAAVLASTEPDVVFGEATEFHELLCISSARRYGIAYLSPNITRYPADRVAFMAYDTLDTVGGDGSVLSDCEADALLDAIRARRVVPSYMRPEAPANASIVWTRLADKLRVTAGWLLGERYITPSPIRKLALNAEQRRQFARWEQHATRSTTAWTSLLNSGRPWALYALQMQPEGNIDVWGSPWNDQVEIIRRAARALAVDGSVLVVKPNPKSKYELSANLNEVFEREPNVIGLPHASLMDEVFPHAPLVLTVTGTVLLEAIFSRKPVASLGTHSMSRYPGVTALSAPEGLPSVLSEAISGRAVTASQSDARELLQSLHTHSYAATLWDPVAHPEMATEKTIEALTAAFVKVLGARAHTNASHVGSQPNIGAASQSAPKGIAH